MNYEFASDNTAASAPELIDAITRANQGATLSYGDDPWTAEMIDAVTAAFELPHPAGVVPILSGKLANHLSLAAITEPGGLIFCHEHAHIMIDENDGPPYVTRCELIGIPGDADKIPADALRAAIASAGTLPPGSAFSLTNVTEAGAVYTLDEMRTLADIAHAAGLPVHLDGARFSNAVVALDCSLADITWRSGVDILSLGATKNGGLAAEAVVSFVPSINEQLTKKQLLLCHYPSKMRFLSAQITAWLAGDAWRARAENANAMAAKLAAGLRSLPGAQIVQPVDANIIFVALTPELQARVDAAEYYVYPASMFGERVVRFVTNWATTSDSIDRLMAVLMGDEVPATADAGLVSVQGS